MYLGWPASAVLINILSTDMEKETNVKFDASLMIHHWSYAGCVWQ